MIIATTDNTNDYAEDGQVEYLIGLLDTSSLNLSESELIRGELEDFKVFPDRFEELKEYLLRNQVCPISAGRNYNMTDINKKIRREIL